jgi:two-component system, chemotaxis family, chemotaxis protein CheY
MLKAVIIDSNATSRGLLQTILNNNGWEVVGHTNTNAKGLLLIQKFQPHFVCLDMEHLNDGTNVMGSIRENWPKTLVFVTSSAIDAATAQDIVARGVHGFFLKPFNQVTVANTIRNAVLRLVKNQQTKTES